MTDRTTLRLHRMRFFGRIGHTQEERIVGTHVEVDLALDLDLGEGLPHDLEATLDYRALHAAVADVVEEGDHPLLEGLAVAVLDALEVFPWTRALVRVRKPRPPIEADIGAAEVEMERHRG